MNTIAGSLKINKDKHSEQQETANTWDTYRWFTIATLTILFAGVAAVVIYSAQYPKTLLITVATAGFVTAIAFLLVGGLIGFLFGIPRSQSQPDHLIAQASVDSKKENGSGYSANTNLEQISDWLTKILVGVGLTQIPAIRLAVHDLIYFLSPAFGGRPDSPVFAFVLVVYFVTAGFVLGYLWSRIVLPGQFRAADIAAGLATLQSRVEKAEKVTEDVRKTVEEQAEIDARVLSMASAVLNPIPGSTPPTQQKLNEMVGKASPSIRVQIFGQAQLQRMENWRNPADLPKMELTIPIFRALIAADKQNEFDRNHAQLGYALKDKRQPDWAEAEKELNEAIRIRGPVTAWGYLYYEFNRACCRIQLDPGFQKKEKSSKESLSVILDDLRLCTKAGLERLIRERDYVRDFLALNEINIDSLAETK